MNNCKIYTVYKGKYCPRVRLKMRTLKLCNYDSERMDKTPHLYHGTIIVTIVSVESIVYSKLEQTEGIFHYNPKNVDSIISRKIMRLK